MIVILFLTFKLFSSYRFGGGIEGNVPNFTFLPNINWLF